MGLWLLLFTELILWGGLFLAYAVYRFTYAGDFRLAAEEMDTMMGTVNTIILLSSSLTAVFSVTALRQGRRRLAVLMVVLTLLFAVLFLVNRYFEWSHRADAGIVPGAPLLLERPPGETIYSGLYDTMTGLHGLHVLAGMALFGWVLRLMAAGRIHPGAPVRLENVCLYWHLVDIIWIFLFPLFYLMK